MTDKQPVTWRQLRDEMCKLGADEWDEPVSVAHVDSGIVLVIEKVSCGHYEITNPSESGIAHWLIVREEKT